MKVKVKFLLQVDLGMKLTVTAEILRYGLKEKKTESAQHCLNSSSIAL